MAKHGVATISTTTAGARIRTCAADLSRARHQSVFDAAMAPAQESGLRENCTSRLSERAEAEHKLHLSRLYSYEAGEQSGTARCGAICSGANCSGVGGAKGGDQGKSVPANHALGTEPDQHRTWAGAHTESRKGKEEGEVHLALPPHQHRSSRGRVLRTQGGRGTGCGPADVEGLRGRP